METTPAGHYQLANEEQKMAELIKRKKNKESAKKHREKEKFKIRQVEENLSKQILTSHGMLSPQTAHHAADQGFFFLVTHNGIGNRLQQTVAKCET
ncbi:hypothetical protein ACOMHN_042046 [Nucella lapillus]